jgi:hypothetical protein
VLIQTAIIFFISRRLLLRSVSTASANLILAFLLSGISFLWSEFFYGQGQYGNVLMFLLIEIALVLILLEGNQTRKVGWFYAIFFLVNFYVNSTSVRYLAFFVCPSLLALIYLYFSHPNRRKVARNITLLLLISTIFGQCLFVWLKHSYIFLTGADGATLVSYHDMLFINLPRVLDGFFSLICDEAVGVKLSSIAGVIFMERLIFCVMFFLAPFYFLLSKWSHRFNSLSACERYLVLYFYGISFICFFSVLFLAFTVNLAAAARYIMLPIFLGVFISAFLIHKGGARTTRWLFLICMVPALIFNMYSLNKDIFNVNDGDKQQLVNFLVENNLDRGFATYWNADVLTVLSNYKIMVAHIENERLIPSLFMSTKEFYKSVGARYNFLLLEDSEISRFDLDVVKKSMGEPVRILKFKNYQIFVYEGEFATHIPGWL